MADGRDHRGKETGRGSQSGSLWRGCRETRRFSRGCQQVGYGYLAPVYVEGYYGGYAVQVYAGGQYGVGYYGGAYRDGVYYRSHGYHGGYRHGVAYGGRWRH